VKRPRRLGEPRSAYRRATEKPKPRWLEAIMGRRDLRVGRRKVEGRYVVMTGVVTALTLGMGLWWYSGYTPVHEIQAEDVVINRVVYAVTNWEGVDSDASPLDLHACFLFAEEDVVPDAPLVKEIDPPAAPAWFRCFSPDYLVYEIARGNGQVYLAAENEVDGMDRVVAVLPGNRGFMWRQPHPKDNLDVQ